MLNGIALHYITLHCIILPCIELHLIASLYITRQIGAICKKHYTTIQDAVNKMRLHYELLHFVKIIAIIYNKNIIMSIIIHNVVIMSISNTLLDALKTCNKRIKRPTLGSDRRNSLTVCYMYVFNITTS